MELTVHLKRPHPKQIEFINSPVKRKVVRAGRRGGKTSGAAIMACQQFLSGKRVLYATPTQEQVGKFWWEVKHALREPLDANVLYKNETAHIIEVPGSEQRIRAKTAWDADTLRGDYADLLILDEYQMMSTDAWGLVGAPMLADNNGDAIFIYTTVRGKNHSKDLFKQAKEDTTGRWATFVFSSFDNPHVSKEALSDLTGDMTQLAYRAEILAEEIDDDPRALWKRDIIDHITTYPALSRIGIAVDPTGTTAGDECGIIAGGIAQVGGVMHGYILADKSLHGSPNEWGTETITAYNIYQADRVFAEKNFGGEMVENTLRTIPGGRNISYKAVVASRGKDVRAEPIVALYEQGRIHHAGNFQILEDEMCNWVPGESKYSPNRVDAMVWLFSELLLKSRGSFVG
jgi:hypothetical protein